MSVRHGRRKFGIEAGIDIARRSSGLCWVANNSLSAHALLLFRAGLVRALRIDSVSWVASKFLDRWSKLGPVPVVPELGWALWIRFVCVVLERHGLLASECRLRGSVRGPRGSRAYTKEVWRGLLG